MTPPEPTDEQSLLAAIVETPDDDAPRLVYADWLLSRNDRVVAALREARAPHAQRAAMET